MKQPYFVAIFGYFNSITNTHEIGYIHRDEVRLLLWGDMPLVSFPSFPYEKVEFAIILRNNLARLFDETTFQEFANYFPIRKIKTFVV
jgi:hypothetical protein